MPGAGPTAFGDYGLNLSESEASGFNIEAWRNTNTFPWVPYWGYSIVCPKTFGVYGLKGVWVVKSRVFGREAN